MLTTITPRAQLPRLPASDFDARWEAALDAAISAVASALKEAIRDHCPEHDSEETRRFEREVIANL